MLRDALVFQQQLFGVEVVSKFLFVFDDVVDAIMTQLANEQFPSSHFFFAEPFDIPLLCVDGSGNQVMFCEWLIPAT
jgi:hypothetical protein